MSISAIEFQQVSRHYGAVKAVDQVSLNVAPGEFFSMLGPSGSGKTTCLRLIAGFEQPTAGTVLLSGTPISGRPPFERDVNTVFQDYALFPHLSVQENVEYGMAVRGVAKAERQKRAMQALEQVALGEFGQRRPSQLSGGQRQRVALARAIVNRPKVLLLDEPLGALDMRLREQMQVELKRLHRALGITFVYVTHDQGEAMSMSDRVAVFANGRIEQVDSPRQLYLRPASSFVAEFVGGANVLKGDFGRRVMPQLAPDMAVSVRAEHIALLPRGQATPAGSAALPVVLADVQYHGATTRFELEADGQLLSASLPSSAPAALQPWTPGTELTAHWTPEHMIEVRA